MFMYEYVWYVTLISINSFFDFDIKLLRTSCHSGQRALTLYDIDATHSLAV